MGDEPAWTIAGPTTTLDTTQFNGLKQDEYGVYHLMIEGHFSEAGMGGGMPIHFRSSS